MAAKKNGNGHAPAEATLERILDAVNAQTKSNASGLAAVGERIDALSTDAKAILTRMETRIDEIAKNTGRNQHWIEARLRAIENHLGISPPPQSD